MTKKSNSFKNIRTVLLALLLLGLVAGAASAGVNVTITNSTYGNMEYGVGSNISATANGTNAIYLVLNTSNITSNGIYNINVTNTTLNVTIYNGTVSSSTTNGTNNLAITLAYGTNVSINLTSTERIPFFTVNVWNSTNATEYANSTNLSFVPAASTAVIAFNKSSYVSGNSSNVTVTDSDANLDSSLAETLSVNVTSTTNSTNTTLTLTETGANTSIFNTTTALTFSIVGGSNVLVVSDGDTITANYTHNGVLSSATATFNAVASKLVINSTTYGNLTNMNATAVTPTSMVAGVATVFKINATDANGVLDTGFTGIMTITENGSATITPASPYTFVSADNGTKNISVTDNVAETLLIRFNSTSVTTNASTTETVVPNRPYKLLFNSSMPLSTLTNSLRVNVSVADAYNNLINASKLTGDSFPTNATQLGGTDGLGLGIKFNLTLSLPTAGSAALDTILVVINNTTVNTYVAYVNDTVDQTVVLRAAASFFSPTFINTDLSFLAPVSDLLVSTNKTSNIAHANTGANGLGIINISAQLRDASGNALSVPGTVVTFTSDDTSVLNVVAQTATTNASGIATITVLTTYVAGTANITASDGTGHQGTVTVTTTAVVSSAASTLTVGSATSRAGDNVTVYATIKDYATTVVPGITVSFNITLGDSASTLDSVAKGTIVTAVTNATGVATVTFRGTNGSSIVNYINATIVDEATVVKQVGSLPTITVSPNDAAVLVVLPASKGLANIKGTNATFNVTVYDAYNNVNTSVIKVNVSTTDTTLGNMTVGSTVVNNYAVITTSSGIGSMLYTINSTAVTSATLTFAAYKNETGQLSGLSTNFTDSVFITTSGATRVTITPSVTGAAVNTNITLTVNLTDNDGNLIGIDGTNMNFVSTGGSLSASSKTSVGGQASINLTSSTAGDVTITVYVAGLSSAATTVTFSGNATKFIMTPNTSSAVVNGTINISIQAYDSLNNKASIYNGAAISAQTGVIPAVSGLTFSATSFTFNATGYAMVNVTSATVGTYTIQAVALGLVNTTEVSFTEAVLPALTVSASPENVTVDTPENVTFTVTPALSGVLVTLSGAGVSVNGTTTNGTVTIEDVNATSAGTITVTASLSGYTDGTTTITAESTVTPELTISATPTFVTVGTAENVVFTVTPALSGVLVTLSGAGVSVNGTTTDGTVTISVNATSAASIAVTASLSGYTDGTTTISAREPGTAPILVSAITPNSRNAQVGTPVTIFMTVINGGTATATGVSIEQESSLAATVNYKRWNGTAFIGSEDTPIDLAAGEQADYVLTINATAAFDSSSMTFDVNSTNGAKAPVSAVNTLTISASSVPTPDVIMMATGTMNYSTGIGNGSAFALATMNVGGANATGVSLVVVVPSSITGLVTQVNQTDPVTGDVTGPATGLTINMDETPTFAVFWTPTQAITVDPTNHRITLQLVDGTGKVIGAQSVAISTT